MTIYEILIRILLVKIFGIQIQFFNNILKHFWRNDEKPTTKEKSKNKNHSEDRKKSSKDRYGLIIKKTTNIKF